MAVAGDFEVNTEPRRAPMSPERWQDVRRVLSQGLDLEPEARQAYIESACGEDIDLLREVESLLKAYEEKAFLLEQPALELTRLRHGEKLGIYEIDRLIGAGGMGEVYRAVDPGLRRAVAVKVLPAPFSSDRNRLRRFEIEARAAAALNHPNILAIYQLGVHQGVPYMVSELLEGETLRQQTEQSRMPIPRVIDIATQIARGLAAAHTEGIVHRDLKPENIFITQDGAVKILDFGLSKLRRPPESESAQTRSRQITEPGVVLGTVGYMSPEQVRGQPADARSDIFAFGAVLYEMLSGVRAFSGPSSVETMNAILNSEPSDITRLVPGIPPALQRVMLRCLEKPAERRFQSASDLAFAFEQLGGGSSPAGFRLRRKKLAVIILAIPVAFVAVFGAWLVRERFILPPVQTRAIFERQLTATTPENPVVVAAISRDGRYVAYEDKSNHVYQLSIDTNELRELPITSYEPDDWFPDGNHLLMASDSESGGLWKLSTWDWKLRKLWDGPAGNDAISPDGSLIAFLKGVPAREVWLMGADGEEPHKLLQANDQCELEDISWSPNGRRLALLKSFGTLEKHAASIEACELQRGICTPVLTESDLPEGENISGIAWLHDGRIVYAVARKSGDSNLWAIKTDPASGNPSGQPMRLTDWNNLQAWAPRPSADGRRLVVLKTRSEAGIYVANLKLAGSRFKGKRMTQNAWENIPTTWTTDSKSLLFSSKRNGRWAIFKQDVNSDTSDVVIAGPKDYSNPILSAAGILIYTQSDPPDPNQDFSEPRSQLMSTPLGGGPRSVLASGRYSYRCGSQPLSRCVVGKVEGKQLVFFSLDPVHGIGGEIGRVAYREPLPRWTLSPDGNRVAIADVGGEIPILDLVNRSVEKLPIQGWKWQWLWDVAWGADGKSFFAVAGMESSNVLLSIDLKGRSKVRQEVVTGQTAIRNPLVSPDGNFLAFTKTIHVSDLVALENF